MLVLSRRKNETVVLAKGTPYETTLTIVEIRGDKVRIGFAAADSVSINRGEVQASIDWQAENPTENKVDRRRATPEEESEIRELDRLTEQVKRDPTLIEKYDLRNIALERLKAIEEGTKLSRRLSSFLESLNRYQKN